MADDAHPADAHAHAHAGPDPARLFLALWPDATTRRALQAWQDAATWPADARVTSAANLHLTLHFIGAVPRARLPALCHGLACPAQPFTLRLSRFTLWRGGVAVLQPADDDALPPPLAALHAGLAEALKRLDLPVDTRPFRPHVTLARHAGGAALAGPSPAAVDWPCPGGHVLAESAGGYRVLQRYGDAG